MKRLYIWCLAFLFLLSSCGFLPARQTTPQSLCGNGKCETGETTSSCRQDCASSNFSGRIQITSIKSEDVTDGSSVNIAVMIASPQVKRYPEGGGIVVVIPPIFSSANSFMRDPDFTSLGLIQVSFLWPGQSDGETGTKSGGQFDQGGASSIKILRDVIRFAGGRLADVNGRYIFGLASLPPLTDEVGLYAFGDAGLAAVKALSLYGDQFQGLQYYVGRENPSDDTLASYETGYYDETGRASQNPFYLYPDSYSFEKITLNYTNLRWDPTYTSTASPALGRPYLDLDGNGTISAGDFVFDGQIPVVNGQRVFSMALTQALMDNGALSSVSWPADLATPQESLQYWQFLLGGERFSSMQANPILKNLKVMLVFAQQDHAQVAPDKPHIHQAYQGFRFEARLWVRLNPDRAYIQDMLQKTSGQTTATSTIGPALEFPDNPANTEPEDWLKIDQYAYPGQGEAEKAVPLAAVAEMADRAHSGDWDENIGQVLYLYTGTTPTK